MYSMKNLMADIIPVDVASGARVSSVMHSLQPLSVAFVRAQSSISRKDDVETSAAVSPKQKKKQCCQRCAGTVLSPRLFCCPNRTKDVRLSERLAI